MNESRDFGRLKSEIIDKELCTRCGTCMGVCPSKCISFDKEQILKNDNQCIKCGQCLLNCPGKTFNFKEQNKRIFNCDYDSKKLLGTYQEIYAGYSRSASVRDRAASGGIITEIATFLLKEHYVDGIVVVTGTGKSQDTEVNIARTPEEIFAAAQSKYTIIPTNKIIRTILEEEGKYAYIGLPCQIHGIRKAMDNNAVLRSRIFMVIGLFCGFNMYYGATEYLIKKSKICPENIRELSYRKKIDGSTGFFVSSDTKEFFVKKHEYTFLNLFFSPKRCLMCYDYSAEFSDISVGDAWELGLGWSRIIVRTDLGQKIIEETRDNKSIFLLESDEIAIKSSQKKILNHKKRDIWYRLKKNRHIPEINVGVIADDIKPTLMARIQYLAMVIGNRKWGKRLLYLMPFSLLRKISNILRK